MSKIGLVGVSTVGGGSILTSPIPQNVGEVDGKQIVGVGSTIAPHGNGPHQNATMIEGTSKFIVDGIQVCRVGDMASCGHALEGGSSLSESD